MQEKYHRIPTILLSYHSPTFQKKRIAILEETEKDWKLLMDCKGTFSVNEIAHFIGIGEYKLFARMREIGILFKNENGDNVPYEKPVHKGKFASIPAIAPDGTVHAEKQHIFHSAVV